MGLGFEGGQWTHWVLTSGRLFDPLALHSVQTSKGKHLHRPPSVHLIQALITWESLGFGWSCVKQQIMQMNKCAKARCESLQGEVLSHGCNPAQALLNRGRSWALHHWCTSRKRQSGINFETERKCDLRPVVHKNLQQSIALALTRNSTSGRCLQRQKMHQKHNVLKHTHNFEPKGCLFAHSSCPLFSKAHMARDTRPSPFMGVFHAFPHMHWGLPDFMGHIFLRQFVFSAKAMSLVRSACRDDRKALLLHYRWRKPIWGKEVGYMGVGVGVGWVARGLGGSTAPGGPFSWKHNHDHVHIQSRTWSLWNKTKLNYLKQKTQLVIRFLKKLRGHDVATMVIRWQGEIRGEGVFGVFVYESLSVSIFVCGLIQWQCSHAKPFVRHVTWVTHRAYRA